MPFFVRWPDGYVPEDHGWIKDARNSRTSGGSVWVRWEIPFKFPAALTETLHDAPTGAVGGFYEGPVGGRFLDPETGTASLGELHAELLRKEVDFL
ncbi:hypothetical protein [Streptomyces sp. NPDC017448]|uniref:hypothetical protein n=1 Tax=Streptomyces sp. NPDC017448 TaxID=3364996 RepID=UPI0037BD1B7F